MTLIAVLTLATVLSFLQILVVGARLVAFHRLMPTLREWDGADLERWPKVSVIVPCRNESAAVEEAMLSLLAQDYPALEVVAIDDRSEDDTGRRLDELAARNPRLTVVHVTDLPSGWLGKNNAMRQGASKAGGEWLLFTDGDVVFAPDALRRSVAFATRHGLGHFVALPHFTTHGFLERAFVSTFVINFTMLLDLSKLHLPKTFAFIGVGAFGLVRRDAYERIGGHEKLAFEVGDDVKLGFLLRRNGVAQGCLDSAGMVRVRWQTGFLATLRGLEKNALVAFEWRPPLALLAVALVMLDNLAPYLVLFTGAGLVIKAIAFAVIGVRGLLVGLAARQTAGGSGLEALAMPLTTFLFPCVILWSTLLTLAQGGIRWRGTFYPLSELRSRRLPVFSVGTDNVVGWTPPPRPGR